MLARRLEPEVMDSAEEAAEYDAMDHLGVNTAFVDDFLAVRRRLFPKTPSAMEILDVGTGTARIPTLLASRQPDCRVTALDLSDEMLKLARRNIEQRGLSGRVMALKGDAKSLPFPDASFDAVLSNSILHHMPEPHAGLAEMVRVARRRGLLFVRDLIRPDTEQDIEHLVTKHAAQESPKSQQLFASSLHAALTLAEVQEMLRLLKLAPEAVHQTSDRHWTISLVL